MSSWGNGFNYGNRGSDTPMVRDTIGGDTAMSTGEVSRALFVALKARAKAKGTTLAVQHIAADIGASTLAKLRTGLPVRASTVLKVCKYLGTDVSNLLGKAQRKEQH